MMKNLFIAMFISISLPHAVFAGTFETSQNSFSSTDKGDGTYSLSCIFAVTNTTSTSFVSMLLTPMSALSMDAMPQAINVGAIAASGSSTFTWVFDCHHPSNILARQPIYFSGDANDPSGNTATVDLLRHLGGEL